MYLDVILSRLHQGRDDVAFHIQGQVHTYADLRQRVSSIFEHVRTFPEPIIGIGLRDHLDTYAAILASWLSGKTMVPIDLDLPPNRVSSILEQTGIKVVLYPMVSKGLPELSGSRYVSTSELGTPARLENLADEEQIAYILFTSGSTGTPKGVPIKHSALDAFLYALFSMPMELGPHDRFLQMFDLTFDLSLMSYVAPLTLGASIYSVGGEGMKYMRIFQILEDHNISIALMVPSVLGHLRPFFDEIQLPAMKYSLFCGEALSHAIATEWQNCVPNAKIFNVYGPTEATIFCMSYTHGPNAKTTNGIVCIGQAMENMAMTVVDEQGNRVPVGEKGELCLAGPQLTPGYWKNPQKTDEVFIEIEGQRFYRSGDIAMEDEDGDFHYLGRVDQQVKIDGFRVELSEIEHWTRTLSGHSQLAAVIHSNAMGANEIYVFIESVEPVDEGELKEKLKRSIPSYMVPKKILSMERLPLNVNGKIDRKALKQSSDGSVP